jgi:two-component system, sensor histidine kinase and response regulator
MARILIVDDEETVRKFLIDTLKFAGYDTISAWDGMMGLKMAEQTLPDLIIADINMPYMDGYTMMDELHNRRQTNTIPIILLTIRDGRSNIRQGMVRGADDYLPKPVLPGEVLASVQTQLQKRAVIDDKHDTNLRMLRRNIIYALPHEFRTPLSIIMGYAQLLQMDHKSAKPDDILELSQSITSAGERLERLIENYLVYAQLEVIEADQDEREAVRNHIVKDAGTVIAEAANNQGESHFRLNDLRLNTSRVALRISEDNLKKIIGELVDNAFKFSKKGSPVEVSTQQQDHKLTVRIRDFGRGMTVEQIKLMGAYMQFGREFFEQQGVGLGFVIAQRLTHLHDGELIIESEPNKGTLITLQFSVY